MIVDYAESDAVCCAAVEVLSASLETPNPALGGLNAFQAVGLWRGTLHRADLVTARR